MICVAIVFTIAFIVIVGGIFGIFWGMHETEENTAIVVSSSGRVKGSSSAIYTINQITWVCSKMQQCATCLQIFIDQIIISQNWTLIEKVKHFLILQSRYANEQKNERNFWNPFIAIISWINSQKEMIWPSTKNKRTVDQTKISDRKWFAMQNMQISEQRNGRDGLPCMPLGGARRSTATAAAASAHSRLSFPS